MATYLLFEAASGYAVFEALDTDLIASAEPRVQESINDLARFGKAVKLAGFRPFTSAADALEQCNAVSEGVLTDELAAFLEQCLPSKKSKYMLGVSDAKLGAAILERSAIRCECNDRVLESLRGVRLHYERLVAGLKEGDAGRAALGLAHAYSRGKVKFNVNRSDNMIIQSIATLDTLDKDINTLVMRVREWYAWHFPELSKVVADNYQYARAALAVQDKSQLTEADLPALAEALGGDEDKAMEVLVAARASMGQDISPVDLQHIEALAKRVVELAEFRQGLGGYLNDKMTLVAPNLGALIGDTVGARLIAHAGSLTNLAKYPASTVQILGAEKALFRALKTKGNTPKYGLIYHSTFIGRAQARNKGRISRYLANKCSIASRIDCFAEESTAVFGNKLREQVEQRLAFYDKGVPPAKNITMMQSAIAEAGFGGAPPASEKKAKKSKKDKGDKEAGDKSAKKAKRDLEETAPAADEPKKKKKKKAAVADE